jgi:hypothetical protein
MTISKLICSFAFLIVIFFLLFIATGILIGKEVNNRCSKAQKEYQEDCVESLMQLLDDNKKDFRSRNSAVWALGQLGDKRALAVLQKYYTADIPARESLEGVISQYELRKAVNLSSGGFNITAFIWRNSINR